MLITFETKAYANITMFGDVAKKLIKYMGHSGSVPSAIRAEDLPQALDKLKAAVQREVQETQQDGSDGDSSPDEEAHVGVDKRAKPLIELLEAAIERNTDVMWRE